MKISDFISSNWYTNLSVSLGSLAFSAYVFSELPTSAQTLDMLSNAMSNFNEVAQESVKQYVESYPMHPTGFAVAAFMTAGLSFVFLAEAMKSQYKASDIIMGGTMGAVSILSYGCIDLMNKAKDGDISGLQFLYGDRLSSYVIGKISIPLAIGLSGVYGYSAIKQLQSSTNRPGEDMDKIVDKTIKAFSKKKQ